MDAGALRPVPDVSAGAWLAPRLGPFGGRVGSVVPTGFEAYARILHPVPGPDGEPTTWAAVCTATGRTPHALMQWHRIAGVVEVTRRQRLSRRRTTTRSMVWAGDEPEEGNLDPASLAALLAVLSRRTAADSPCFFALWEGYGWISGSPAVAVLGSDGPVPPAFDTSVLSGPRLRHPGRNYLLFTGLLPAAAAMGYRWPFGHVDPQSPNLVWPADRSWCVATEIDFDSTMIGGSAALVADVLAEPRLESWRVEPGDSLEYDGDAVNS